MQRIRESYFAAGLQGSQTFSPHEIDRSLGARLPSVFNSLSDSYCVFFLKLQIYSCDTRYGALAGEMCAKHKVVY